MYMIIFIIFASLFISRVVSGYDNRYNDRKYFVIKNKGIAKLLLPKSAGWSRGANRAKANFNKMTYIGAIFYICNVLLILSIPVFLFLVPEINVSPFEIDTRYLYILVDTLNQKLPVLFALLLLAVEIIFEFINVINMVSQSKKQNKKGMIILSSILMVIIGLFGILQVVEIISTIIEVF